MSRFQKATKKQARGRVALCGPSGSGKTYTALLIAAQLGKRIAVIDTERGSASKYSNEPGIPEFDVLELESFAPKTYVAALQDAEKEGYDVVVIDSFSHAWMGKDGALEMADKAATRSKSGNSFNAWKEVTPEHNDLVEAILQSKCHVIATMRAKTEYVIEKDERTGKNAPRKIGMAPIQRAGVEFEFDLVADLDQENNLAVTKSRCNALSGHVAHKAGIKEGKILAAWLSDGIVAPVPAAPVNDTAPASEAYALANKALLDATSMEALAAAAGQVKQLKEDGLITAEETKSLSKTYQTQSKALTAAAA